jgi:surface antigen
VNRAALLDCGWRRAGALASAYDGATVFSSDVQERDEGRSGSVISSDRFANVRAYMYLVDY